VYGCDICQDVCPWNRGVEKRRAGAETRGEPVVSLVDWLESDPAALAHRYDRLYVPHNDGRYLQRNALVALGNSGGPEHLGLLDGLDDEHAAWARGRIEERA
jgi:epoxyqueuosine reductase